MSLPGYDAWKLASPPGYDREPDCPACDDAGCPECCETASMTEDDLIEIEAEMEMAGAMKGKINEQAR
jgi:hypothetical protein